MKEMIQDNRYNNQKAGYKRIPFNDYYLAFELEKGIN